MIGALSEPLGAHKRIDEIEKNAHGHQRPQRIIENHVRLLEPVADVGVENRQQKECDTRGDKDHIQHFVLLGRVALEAILIRFREGNAINPIRKT
jgi:hypothetical protein